MKVKSKFAIPYDRGDEIEMRLYNTVIRYDGEPVIVTGTSVGLDGRYYVSMKNCRGVAIKKAYGNDALFDLSPLPPIYSHFRMDGTWEGTCYHVARGAIRKYQQGGNGGNTKYRRVGRMEAVLPCSPPNILVAYAYPVETKTMKDVAAKYDLTAGAFNSIALSIHVAVYTERDGMFGHHTGKRMVEYHGETVGELEKEDDTYFLKTDNESLSFNPWCVARLEEVGIFVR